MLGIIIRSSQTGAACFKYGTKGLLLKRAWEKKPDTVVGGHLEFAAGNFKGTVFKIMYHARVKKFICSIFFLILILPGIFAAPAEAPEFPSLSINGREEKPTIQDLSGLGTRPLRILVEKNNKSHGDELIQVYAMGVRAGDELKMKIKSSTLGTRVSLFKLFRNPEGTRLLSLPLTAYAGEKAEVSYQEKIQPFRSEFLILAFEKTDTPDVKNNHVKYFEEKERNLAVTSLRTNFRFSSLKMKMKDLADKKSKTFSRDAQELVDNFIRPQRIYILRLWKYDSREDETPAGSVGLGQ